MAGLELMKAARLHGISDFRADCVPVPKITGTELLLRVGACGICGSDLPRIYESGTSNGRYPMTIGHEFSGTIVATSDRIDASLIGKRGAVFPLIPCRACEACMMGNFAMCSHYDYMGSRCDGGFAEYVKIPSIWHFVESGNDGTAMEALCMTEPACVAQHAVRKSGLTAGQTLIVYGAGPIGLMAARWAGLFGASSVLLVDVDDRKVAFARERGLEAINGLKEDAAAVMHSMNSGRPADAAIEGTGCGSALEGCISCVKPSGRIVLMGNPHRETTISLSAHSSILRKELQLSGIWNSNYAPYPINEWRCTVQMIDEHKLQVEDLITHVCDLDDLPRLCSDIQERRVNICKAIYAAGAGS